MGRGDWAAAGTAAVSSLALVFLVYAQNRYQSESEQSEAEQTSPRRGIEQSSDATSRDTTIVVPGVWNSGNTCFLNSLLQAIAASPVLTRHLRNVDELLEAEVIYSGASSPSATAFSRALWSAVNDLQAVTVDQAKAHKHEDGMLSSIIHSVLGSSSTRSSIVLDFSSLEKRLKYISRTFARPHEQQDADELLTITLDVLEKECKYAWRLLSPSLRSLGLDSILHEPISSGDGAVDDFGRSNASWWNQASSTPSKNNESFSKSAADSPKASDSNSSEAVVVPRVPLRNPMEGTLLSLIQCEKCGRKSPLRSTPFCVLAVPIPGQNCSVRDCLKEFVKPEMVDDVECSRCAVVSGRNPKQPARKRLMIGRLPTVLCLRLQRNQFDPRSGHMYKDQSHVVMPKILDISEACFFSVLAKEETNPQQPSMSPWKTDLSNGPDVSVNAMVLALTGQILPPVRSMPTTESLPVQAGQSSADAQTPLKKKKGNTLGTFHPHHEKNTQYRLVAVVEHLGNAFGGHYVAYRLVEKDGQTFWTRCSDDSVLVVPESKVLSSVQCYMCIYERLDN